MKGRAAGAGAWTVCVVGALAISAAACGADGAARTPAAGAAGEAAASPPRQESELPAAVLGEAPPPRGQDLHYLPGDSATRGYLALPEGQGPFPAVLLIHEWNGLVNRIRQVADAFADEGYVALAVDLYHGRVGMSRDENMALVREVQAAPDEMIANLNTAVRTLRALPFVTGRVAAMGWCFGGGVALSFALGGENHEGTAIFYGSLVEDPERLAAITHPVYGTFAELDRGIPPAQVERFAEALRAAGIENDIHVYDDVGHGFWLYVERDPDAATGPATDAWQRLIAYLSRVLR